MGAVSFNCENFCNNISVVGLRELYLAKHPVIRILWVAFLVASFCLIGYFMWSIIVDYKQNPTVTKVYSSLNDKNDIPQTYLFVYHKELTQTTLSRMGLSDDGIRYLNDLVIPDSTFKNANEMVYESSKLAVTEFAKRLNVTLLSDLCLITSHELNNYFKIEIHSGGILNVDPHIIASLPSCTIYELPSTQAAEIGLFGNDKIYEIKINIKPHVPNIMFAIVSGKHYKRTAASDLQSLEYNTTNSFNIMEAASFKRINSHQSPCTMGTKINAERQYSSCQNNCYLQKIKDCANCTSVRFEEVNISSELCSSAKHHSEMCTSERINASTCRNTCPRMCNETVYQMIFSSKPILSDEVSEEYEAAIIVKLLLNFLDAGIMTYEEVKSYSFVNAVSNVGGQLGLWLGLSLATIAQIFMYFLEAALNAKPKKAKPKKAKPRQLGIAVATKF